MRTRIPTLMMLIALLSAGCASQPKPVSSPASTSERAGAVARAEALHAEVPAERPGSGCHNAIPIAATDTRSGIAAENAYIREHFPGYRKKGQSLLFCSADQQADAIDLVGPDGDEISVIFDITSFFGKV